MSFVNELKLKNNRLGDWILYCQVGSPGINVVNPVVVTRAENLLKLIGSPFFISDKSYAGKRIAEKIEFTLLVCSSTHLSFDIHSFIRCLSPSEKEEQSNSTILN
ncbi:hypothetical protein [Seonamhaeicola sp.]|uniref:hypothetical protein n=1 Tax=Seonamhaeicola sp. TaxID=1912245 RepID=UPI00261CC429|nr:hypothetical protein [Seonamhaeicola sp.]